MFSEHCVIVKGGGDLATAVIHKLFRAGFQVVVTELEKPMMVRRNVSFANCIYENQWAVEGITSVKTKEDEVDKVLKEGNIPVLIDPKCNIREKIKPDIIIDAILAKRNVGTKIDDAPIVIGLGPGFYAGKDVDVVIETNRGHDLGKIILSGEASSNTGIPGSIGGYTIERVLRAPCQGTVINLAKIGSIVNKGDVICTVDGVDVCTEIDGVVRGLIKEGLNVRCKEKIGDVDPRGNLKYCNTISDKGRNIAGGVLEAVLFMLNNIEKAS